MNDDYAANQTENLQSAPEADDARLPTPFDLGSLIEAIAVQWRWVAANALLLLFLGFVAAAALLGPRYSVPVQLTRYEPPLASDSFKPQPLSTAALFGMVAASDALQRTGSELTPPLTAEQLARRLTIAEDHSSELITVTAAGRTPRNAVSLANLFSADTVRFTQAMQKDEAIEAGRLIARQLASTEGDLARVKQQLSGIETLRAAREQDIRRLSSAPTIAKVDTAKITRLDEKTQAARDELADLQARYTDAHPLVREQKARLAALEVQLLMSVNASKADDAVPAGPFAAANPGPQAPPATGDQSSGYDALALRLSTLEASHADFVARQRAIELFATQPPGYLRVVREATVDNVVAQRNRLTIGVLAVLCSLLGALGTILFMAIRELLDDRLKTGADVRRVTHLPLIATLGNLGGMSPANEASWAFRTWNALQRRLSVSQNHGMVCGFTSSGPGEGRSTWIRLLSQSARQCGFTVLTISSPPEPGSGLPGSSSNGSDPDRPAPPAPGSTAFTAMVLATPAQLMEKLTGPSLALSVNLPLPGGWIWDLERRKQWQQALNSWKAIEHVVILVELPPVSDPETVLLAENMPNLIWLAESNKAGASETIEQLETLRNARCRLVGAVLNREPASPSKRRLSRWFGNRPSVLASAFGLMAAFATAQVLTSAAAADPAPAPLQAGFGVMDSAQRAPWQQRLTLGPGDLLNFSVFGQPELTQTHVPVGPDGRISYLEAQNIMAAGLTVDEFRAALNTELAKSRNAPEVIVIPAAYRSKKYYVLGAVVKKGAFPINRPITIIEAVSQADGLETGVSDHNLVVLADLSRSFIARQGKHLPVDFEKLFLEGDLSQNIPIEPDDYLYFPGGERQQIYVLGEVRFPGSLAYDSQTSTLEAVSVRGGFSERAWRTRLLVIRGSLDHPQTFVVNASDVLSGKVVDFQLRPRDIVYVSSRPWFKAEELLDIAASAFVQAAVITETGLHVDPIGSR